MPQKVVCEKCGEILYEGGELKPPDVIIQMHNGKCPKCGRRLSYSPINTEVKPAS
jgi:transcription initiation factor IIE alpha subunit